MRTIASRMYWVMIGIIVTQFFLLMWRGVGLLPVWTLIEYMQLVAFMPIYNFRLIPYLYDAFKPALVSHMIIFDKSFWLADMDDDYFNDNYEHYWLSIGRMGQSLMFICIFTVIIVLANFIIFFMSKCFRGEGTCARCLHSRLAQFKFNVYIRAYMLFYFDLAFFSVMKIVEGKNETTNRKIALLASYVFFVVSIVVPVFLITLILRRFEVLKIKEAKKNFNTLLLRIDKASKWRAMNPSYFFARRLLTAVLLTLPIDNTFIFLQYVFILMSSHAYILYMVACKPYQTPGINSYVLANETFYSALIIAIFIFSDATPEMTIKFGAGVALMTSLCLLVIANVFTNIVYMIKGKARLKREIKESKLKRAEKEALERAEEEERRLKKKKEEEEFTKLPDDTANLSQVDVSGNTTSNTMSDLNMKSNKKGGKKKKVDDNVANGEFGNVDNGDFNTKKRRRKDKKNSDNLENAEMADSKEGFKKKRTKKTKGNNDDPTTTTSKPTTTTNMGTDFGTTNTQKTIL